MKRCPRIWLLFLALPIAGCQEQSAGKTGPPPDPEANIQAMLAQLGPEDQRQAEQQRYCPLMPQVRLGEMGPPKKIVVNGESLFVCCRTCLQLSQDDPDKASAQVKEFKEARAKEPQPAAKQ